MDKPKKPYILLCNPSEVDMVRICVAVAFKSTEIEVIGSEFVDNGKTYLVDVKKLDPLNILGRYEEVEE